MTFITILVALLIERFFHWHHLRQWHWFSRYLVFMNRFTSRLPVTLNFAVCLIVPLLVVGIVQSLLSNVFYGVLELIFGIIIMVYCFGPANLWLQVYSCLNELNKENSPAARQYVGDAFSVTLPETSQALHQQFTRGILWEAHQRIFAVIFWFLILGPVGAVLYRMIVLCKSDALYGFAKMALQYQRVLDWIPARIFSLFFALGGHFSAVTKCWKKDTKFTLDTNDILISDCGMAALDVVKNDQVPEDGTAEKEALALLDRAFVITLVILAVIVLIV